MNDAYYVLLFIVLFKTDMSCWFQRCLTNVPGVDIQFDIVWSFPIHRRKNTSRKFQDVDEKIIDCSLWSMRLAAPCESTRLCVNLNR